MSRCTSNHTSTPRWLRLIDRKGSRAMLTRAMPRPNTSMAAMVDSCLVVDDDLVRTPCFPTRPASVHSAVVFKVDSFDSKPACLYYLCIFGRVLVNKVRLVWDEVECSKGRPHLVISLLSFMPGASCFVCAASNESYSL